MKNNPITVGFDDATFKLKSQSLTTKLIGVICQGVRMVNVVQADITIDGNDGTKILINLVKNLSNSVQFILTHTITFGGFNIIDLDQIYSVLKIPIIAINERKVNLDAVIQALKQKYPDNYRKKIQTITNAGELFQVEVPTAGGTSHVYFHSKGIDVEDVKSLLHKVSIDAKIPECIRMAHLVGRLYKH
ncbi:MAG: endonuclease dU [Promethearchaeota archaeon]|jgi:endonuclease V-like protein UPF0215 family